MLEWSYTVELLCTVDMLGKNYSMTGSLTTTLETTNPVQVTMQTNNYWQCHWDINCNGRSGICHGPGLFGSTTQSAEPQNEWSTRNRAGFWMCEAPENLGPRMHLPLECAGPRMHRALGPRKCRLQISECVRPREVWVPKKCRASLRFPGLPRT